MCLCVSPRVSGPSLQQNNSLQLHTPIQLNLLSKAVFTQFNSFTFEGDDVEVNKEFTRNMNSTKSSFFSTWRCIVLVEPPSGAGQTVCECSLTQFTFMSSGLVFPKDRGWVSDSAGAQISSQQADTFPVSPSEQGHEPWTLDGGPSWAIRALCTEQ